jgi:hypothetical protein
MSSSSQMPAFGRYLSRKKIFRVIIKLREINPRSVRESMGPSYCNFTLFGPERRRVVDALRAAGRDVFVSPSKDGFTTVYDRESEEHEFEVIQNVGGGLSRQLDCPVLGVTLHHGDVLYYWLFRDGEVVDFYNSCPDYFDADADGTSPPSGGDADELRAAFGQGSTGSIEEILRSKLDDDEGKFLGEEERHQALVKAIGMPIFSVGLGYDGLDACYLPEAHRAVGLTRAHFTRVGQC